MKISLTALIIAISALANGAAQAGNEHAGHGMASPTAAASAMPMVDGKIKKIDKSTGKVTLAHGPLVNLDMPPMTMAFRVKEAAWLDQMKVGDKIRFMADNLNGELTVVQFQAAK